MIDHDRTAARARPADTLPAFAPVPRERARHYGWTPDRQRGFIEALADTGSVKAAAHAVNMTPEGAYLLRRHADASEFRAAWEAALALGVQRLEDTALDRALNGVEVPVYGYGKIIGTRRVYNDSLLMFLLRNRANHRFNADTPLAQDAERQGHMARMKAQWRKEWEAEQAAAAQRSSDEVLAGLNAKLDRMREEHEARAAAGVVAEAGDDQNAPTALGAGVAGEASPTAPSPVERDEPGSIARDAIPPVTPGSIPPVAPDFISPVTPDLIRGPAIETKAQPPAGDAPGGRPGMPRLIERPFTGGEEAFRRALGMPAEVPVSRTGPRIGLAARVVRGPG